MGQKSNEEPLAEPDTNDVSVGERGSTPSQSCFGDTEVMIYRPFDALPLKWDPRPEDE